MNKCLNTAKCVYQGNKAATESLQGVNTSTQVKSGTVTAMKPTKAPWAKHPVETTRRPTEQYVANQTPSSSATKSNSVTSRLNELIEALRRGSNNVNSLANALISEMHRLSANEEGLDVVSYTQAMIDALNQNEQAARDWSTIGSVIALLYSIDESARPVMRLILGDTLAATAASRNGSCWEAAAAVLVAVHRVFRGLPRAATLAAEHQHLVKSQIVPLLQIDSTVAGIDPPRHVLEPLSVALLPVLVEACCRLHGLASQVIDVMTSAPVWNPLSPLKQASLLRLAVQLVLALPQTEGSQAASKLSFTLERHVMDTHLATAVAALRSLPSLASRLAQRSSAFERLVTAVHAGGTSHWSDEIDRYGSNVPSGYISFTFERELARCPNAALFILSSFSFFSFLSDVFDKK